MDMDVSVMCIRGPWVSIAIAISVLVLFSQSNGGHRSWAGTGVFLLIGAPPDTPRTAVLNFADSSISDSVIMAPGGIYDSEYILLHVAPAATAQFTRSRFVRNGNFGVRKQTPRFPRAGLPLTMRHCARRT